MRRRTSGRRSIQPFPPSAPACWGQFSAAPTRRLFGWGVIYAALDNQTQIDIPHLEAALAVWSFCDESATQIFGDLVGDDVADTILQALRAASPNGITRTEISGVFSRHQSSSRISLELDLLRRLGRARVGVTLANRHRVETWFVVEEAS